jgi:hypothetical protein
MYIKNVLQHNSDRYGFQMQSTLFCMNHPNKISFNITNNDKIGQPKCINAVFRKYEDFSFYQ